MTIKIRSISKKGNAMLTIVVFGKSYTRHCMPLGNGKWQGHKLDFERGTPNTLRMYETA